MQRHGHHPAAWRHPSCSASGRPDLAWWLRAAIGLPFEPFTLLSAIAAVTSHIGLIATVNTNYEHPYHVARKFSSLDHLSGGRAGWNVVSSFAEHTAGNFGIDAPRSHAQRYARADEFVALSKALWDSWDDDAFDRPDRAGGQFSAPNMRPAPCAAIWDWHGPPTRTRRRGCGPPDHGLTRLYQDRNACASLASTRNSRSAASHRPGRTAWA
ncbi:MAG: LLM class flavin-dependent oxidoreductase [Janthinobacterium sp.]